MTKKSKKSKRNRKNFKKPLAILFLAIITGALTLHELSIHLQGTNNPITNLIQNLNEPEKIIPQDQEAYFKEMHEAAWKSDFFLPIAEKQTLVQIPKDEKVDPDFFNPFAGTKLNLTEPIFRTPPWMETP